MEDMFFVENYMLAGTSSTKESALELGRIASRHKVHIRLKNLLKDCMDNE